MQRNSCTAHSDSVTSSVSTSASVSFRRHVGGDEGELFESHRAHNEILWPVAFRLLTVE